VNKCIYQGLMKEFLSLDCEWLVGKVPIIPKVKAAVGYVNVIG